MSETVSKQLMFISAAVMAALCMGSAPAKAFFQPTLGIATEAEVGAVSRSMGDGIITAVTGIPMLPILLHGATTALRMRTGSTSLCIQNTLALCRFGVADRTMRPVKDRGRSPLTIDRAALHSHPLLLRVSESRLLLLRVSDAWLRSSRLCREGGRLLCFGPWTPCMRLLRTLPLRTSRMSSAIALGVA